MASLSSFQGKEVIVAYVNYIYGIMNYFKLRKLKKEIAPILEDGGIGILPTDTLYGIVCSALKKEAVERVYLARKRNPKKPSIILISSISDIKLFSIKINRKQKKFLKKVWPGKVSVVLECFVENFRYLHRGTDSLAFRVPKDKWLRSFLKKTGPLIAPSANFEGEVPAKTKDQAREYFGNNVDFYVDLDELDAEPSTVIRLEKNGEIIVFRK